MLQAQCVSQHSHRRSIPAAGDGRTAAHSVPDGLPIFPQMSGMSGKPLPLLRKEMIKTADFRRFLLLYQRFLDFLGANALKFEQEGLPWI